VRRAHEETAAFEYPTPELVECPYAFYERLRDEAPVSRLANGDFVVSRWEDITYAARHPEIYSNFVGPANPGFDDAYNAKSDTEETLTPWPLPFTDPPEHKLKRSLLLPVVGRDRLKSFEPMIRGLADELIDRFVDRGEVEFKSEFAMHFPPLVMLRVVGVPQEDEDRLRKLLSVSQGAGFRHASPEQRELQATGKAQAAQYFRQAIIDRAETPRDDFISELVQAKLARDGTLDINYLSAEVTNLYGAAYHNTVYMLSNTMVLLLRHPDEMERVRADHSLLRTAIDESLRLESPVQWLQRITTQDTELGGVAIPEGSIVLLLWGSGNRDERKFEDPDRFRADRPKVAKEQLGFGQGTHLCVGAPLARLEGQIAFEQLLTRLKNIRLSDRNEDRHITTVNHRAPEAVHIEFERA
jgi:cytochrome P450